MEQDQPTAFEQAASVFEGRVHSIEGPEGSGGAEPLVVTLDVVRTWKGADAERVTVRTPASSAACGYAFEQGRSYLVYTHQVDGAEHVSLCSRTQPIEQAEEDLAAMGEGVTPVSPHDPTGTAETPETNPAPAETQTRTYRAGCASCAVGTDRSAAPALFTGALLVLATLLRRQRRE